jgi:sugar/nucleoside kinase (ribokinase family)
MSNMLVIGTVAFDTLHIVGRTYSRILGGSATYASIAGAYFTQAQLVAIVGRDFPAGAATMLRERPIDLSGLEQNEEGETFHWEGQYADDFSSRTTLRTDLNVFADYKPKIPNLFKHTPYVLLSNLDPEQQINILDQLERPRLVVADTMNLWISSKPNELRKLLARVGLLVINDEEARQLAEEQNLIKAAYILQRLGPATVIIKKGEHGVLSLAGTEMFSLPALPVGEVADPTGAGDTFAGALVGYLARTEQVDGLALRKAIAYGSVLASYCVEGIGVVRLASVSTREIYDRFQQLSQLVHFPVESDLD